MKKSQSVIELQTLQDISHETLTLAKKHHATSAEVSAAIEDGYTVTVRMGKLDTIEYHLSKALGITVYFGQRTGSVSTSMTDHKSLEKAIKKACDIARYTQEDDCAGLADAGLMAKELPDLDLYHPWDLDPKKAIKLALQCEKEAHALDKRIKNSESISVSTHKNFSVYANSHGFVDAERGTDHHIGCELIAEQNHEMERDYYYSVARNSADLESFSHIAKKAAERTVSRLGARKLKTQHAPIIFSAETAKSLLSHFISAIRGGNLYRKSSFLLDSINTQVFPKHIRIYENPYLLKGAGSTACDAEGVTTQAKDFVKNGIVQSYVLGSYSARKLGLKTTANAGGVHNLFIDTSDSDLTALLKQMHTGLLVTDLIGQGVHLITGDYSRGAFGFWVENGEIQYPVSEITIAGNLRDMFMRLIAVGNDIDTRGNIQTGSILIENMMIAGY